MMVWVLEFIIFSMKSVFFYITLLAKVHKSVGFGSAERCSDDDNDNENLRIKHC